MKIKYTIFNLILIFLITSFLSPISLSAQEMAEAFNPNYIISDEELIDYQSMSAQQIQQFLQLKESFLADHSTLDAEGVLRPAADIIWLAANTYQINPKYLLALLQKEQSLITNSKPDQRALDWATGYAVCDGCSTDDPLIQKFKGFGRQVDRAAWRNRYYIEHPEEFKWQVGETYDIDGIEVTIYNQATVNLYIYTPHIHGNYNFWKLWNMWFLRKYPDGSLLKIDDEPGIWLIQNSQRRPFFSKGAFLSRYDPNKVLIVGRNDLAQFEIGKPIKFPQYSLLQTSDKKIYLVVDDYAKPIESNEVFKKIGFNPEEVIEIENVDLEAYQISDPITMDSAYPTGALLQDKTTGGVYYVENGMKYPVWARELIQTNFKNMKIQAATAEELSQFLTQQPVKFKDGELVSAEGDPTVYVISHGQKLPIISAEAFEEIGYKWENIIHTNAKVLTLHTKGEEIKGFIDEEIEEEKILKEEIEKKKLEKQNEIPVDIPATDDKLKAKTPVIQNLDDRMSIEAYKTTK